MKTLGLPTRSELRDLLPFLTPQERAEVDLLTDDALWVPLPGPQVAAYLSPADELFYGGQAGGGKALTLDTPLPTNAGWTTMADVQVGDTLFDEQGEPCRVSLVSPALENHKVYEVCFDDGSSIRADAGHKWLVFSLKDRDALMRRTDEYRERRRGKRPSRGKGKRPDLVEYNKEHPPKALSPPTGRTLTTEQISKTLFVRKAKRTNYSVPVAHSFQLPDIDLPIHPYVLGAWLGDGTSAGQGLTSNDDEIVERIRQYGYKVVKWGAKYAYGIRGIKSQLRELDLLKNKHIPPQYLRASEWQRIELLRGLMDTDGTALPSGACEYYSINSTLAQHVWELLLSLGFKCSIGTGRATLNGKDCGEKYRIKFTTARRVFHLPRKAQRQVTQERGVQSWRYIVDVKPVESVPVRCIQVDSPSRLYLAGRSMIPTHNSDLLLGLALTAHKKSIFFRREYPQLKDVILRSHELLEDTGAGFNSNTGMWRGIPDGRILEFGSCQYEKDVVKYKGRPHDLVAFDEVADFGEFQFRFLMGWARTTEPGQRVRVIAAGNPPTTPEGRWVVKYWAPWLDEKHPNPAEPGELRWFARMGDEDVEVGGGESFTHDGEAIQPKSRTFIPARLEDNPYLADTGYKAILQGLPEPLRSQLLYGDFTIGISDDPWQIIPTAWVRLAQERWKQREKPDTPMTALGVDVARGGDDQTVLAARYDNWFAPLKKYPGKATPDGPTAATAVLRELGGERPPINIDIVGVGASVYDILRSQGLRVRGVNFAEATAARDRTRQLQMRNVRAEAYWAMREALDPHSGNDVALPDDPELLADLTAPKWQISTGGVLVESKEDIIKRLRRSPDCGDAVVLANLARGGVFLW